MHTLITRSIAALFMLVAFGTAAKAQIVIDEARFGVAWAQPEWLPGNNREEDQVLITGEVLFAPFDFDMRENPTPGFIREVLTPRFHIGAILNPDDDGTSAIYAGLTWHHEITELLFIETSFGFGVNDGEPDLRLGGNRADLGSHLLFRESIAVGFNLTDTTTLLFQAAHQSHAGLAGDDNHGLTNFGTKLGFKF